MAMENRNPAPAGETRGITSSRRHAAMHFQFDELTIRDASCLAPALSVLDAADRARIRPGTGAGRDLP